VARPPADSRRRYRLLARRADAVTTPSRTTKTRVREYGAAGEDVRVLPESIDFDLVESAGVDDRFDAVYARRLDRHANVETFLLGLAELRDRDWTAAVVGDGPERARIESTASDLRIDDRVSFLGDLPLRERVELFKGTHVAVATATWETFATDLLWALACGCVALVEYQADSSAHELVEGASAGGSSRARPSSPTSSSPSATSTGRLSSATLRPTTTTRCLTEWSTPTANS